MARDSQAAAIFYVWTRHLREELFSSALNVYWNRQRQSADLDKIVSSTSYEQILNALTARSSSWCGGETGAGGRSCAYLLSHSLNITIKELKKLRGSDMDSWRWGDIHHTLYEHRPFSDINSLDSIFERRIASGGSPNTINVANAVYDEAIG